MIGKKKSRKTEDGLGPPFERGEGLKLFCRSREITDFRGLPVDGEATEWGPQTACNRDFCPPIPRSGKRRAIGKGELFWTGGIRPCGEIDPRQRKFGKRRAGGEK